MFTRINRVRGFENVDIYTVAGVRRVKCDYLSYMHVRVGLHCTYSSLCVGFRVEYLIVINVIVFVVFIYLIRTKISPLSLRFVLSFDVYAEKKNEKRSEK